MTGPISAYFIGVKGGLVMSMIAFSIVFIVIVGLMLIMMTIKHMASAIEGKGKDGSAGGRTENAPAAPAAPMQAVTVQSEDDGELLAVISAAITAMCGSAARVIAFSPVVRAPNATGWKLAARMNNLDSFQD